MATTSMTRVQGNASRWVRHGVVGGVIARLVFAVFEMVMAAVLDGAEACSMPLRRLGAMVLKQEAFDPGYSLVGAGAAAVLVHVMLSAVFGGVFGASHPRGTDRFRYCQHRAPGHPQCLRRPRSG